MKVAKSGDVYLMRLDPNEDILETLQQWCQRQNIVNGLVHGIGSVESPMLAHYRRDTKRFTQKRLSGIFEIISLEGNIGQVDGGQPLVHVHVTVANEHLSAYGGHLVSGACSATAELVIRPLPTQFRKNYEESVGLKVWDFDS